jgi:hypothetical protein
VAGPRPDDPAELEAQLDRLCALDEPDQEDEDEYWDHDGLTAEELAEILQAAASSPRTSWPARWPSRAAMRTAC